MARDKRWDLIPPLRYDADEIKQRIPFAQAFENYTGMQYTMRKNIKCIDANAHKNGDKKPSMHCYENGCRCFTCNKSWDVFQLAADFKGLDRKSEFGKICEELCNDFGIDRYSVSNLAERESAIQQQFGQGHQEKQEYREYFPFTDKELEIIGLHQSNGRQEVKYTVPAEEYYCHFNKCKPENLPQRIRKRLTDENGKPVMIEATHAEMVDMGYFPDSYTQGETRNGHDFLPKYTVKDLWEEDKESAEEMIIGKCCEMSERISTYIERLQNEVNAYIQSHDMDAETDFVQSCIDAVQHPSRMPAFCTPYSNLKLSSPQKERLNAFYDFKNDLDKIETYRTMLTEIEGVYDKINNFLVKRAEHEAMSNSNKPITPNLPE